MPVSTHNAAQQNSMKQDAAVHEAGLKNAEKRREQMSEEKRLEGSDRMMEKAQEKHEKVLLEQQGALERDAHVHETGLKEAEERRNELSEEERRRIKNHNAIDERTDNVLDRHEKILADRQDAEERDLKSHEHGMEEAERRRDEIAQNELDRIKAHNAIDERTDQVLDRHEKILSDRQAAEERDLESHEHGLEEAERRRDENAQNELDRIKAHNAIDERTDNVLDRHDKILSDRQVAEERDLESHEHGMEEAERRRDEIAQKELDRIKAHNAIDERTDQVLDRHEKILSDRQAAEERDLKSHEHGLEEAEHRRDEIAQKELDRIKAHNAIDERTDQVLDHHDKILSDRQAAEERDLESHEHGMEEAEHRRDEIAQNELDRIKAHNAIDKRTDQVLDRHEKILSDRQAAEERDLESHEHGLEEAERRRDENAQNELDRIKAHNAIDERTDQVLDRHDKILSDRQAAEERDLESHEHGLEEAQRRRDENAQYELDRIKAHNAIEERTDQVLDRHDKILSDRQAAEERDLESHEHGLEEAERRRDENAQNELDRIKAHNALEEKSKQALEKKSRVLSEHEKSAERDLHMHEEALDKAEHRRSSIHDDEMDRIKANNALEEKSKQALEKKSRVLTEQEKSAERDIHDHDKALDRAEQRRASIREDQIRSIKAYNNLDELEQRAAEKREELAAANSQSLEEDIARTEARMERAEKVKSETVKDRARAAKETLMNLNDVRKRHEEIERERERNAILHFERVDDGVNRAIARRDSAVGDSMDVSKTRAYPSQAAHTDSSEIVE